MTGQNLLNIYFCDIFMEKTIERNGRMIHIASGTNSGGISLLPAESQGVCYVCEKDKCYFVDLQKLDCAFVVPGSAGFVLVEFDNSFCRDVYNVIPHGKIKKIQSDHQTDVYRWLSNAEAIIEESDELYIDKYKVSFRTRNIERQISGSRGQLRVAEAADIAGCSTRHIYREFADEVGIGPKRYARIMRIRITMKRMMESPYGHINSYMDGMGYSDQAHFQREFKWYTGYTPGSFLQTLKLVYGKNNK